VFVSIDTRQSPGLSLMKMASVLAKTAAYNMVTISHAILNGDICGNCNYFFKTVIRIFADPIVLLW